MLSSEEKLDIIKGALASGHKGSIGDLINQQEAQASGVDQIADTPEKATNGLRGQPEGSSMSFPNSSGDFNTMGMTHPIDMKKVDKKGNVVASYESVPPGIENIPMGDDVGTVIETPGTYKKGGFKTGGNRMQLAGFDQKKNKEEENKETGISDEFLEKIRTKQKVAAEYRALNGETPLPTFEEGQENYYNGVVSNMGDNSNSRGDAIKSFSFADYLSPVGDAKYVAGATKDMINNPSWGNAKNIALGAAFAALPGTAKSVDEVKSLYRVVDAPDIETARRYATHVPAEGTVGRRTGIQGDVQSNTGFDHINATTDQSWILGKNSLVDRYGGKNPYVVKLKPNSDQLKRVNVSEFTDDALAKIKPGTGTNMQVTGAGGQNITTLLGPKGSQVAEVDKILSAQDFVNLHNQDPKFKWKEGGFKTGGNRMQYAGPRTDGPRVEPLNDAEMSLKIYNEANSGNTAAQRMIKDEGQRMQIPEVDGVSTHYMSAWDNHAVPTVQEKYPGGPLTYDPNPAPSKKDFRFDTDEQADFFAKHYKTASASKAFHRKGGVRSHDTYLSKRFATGGDSGEEKDNKEEDKSNWFESALDYAGGAARDVLNNVVPSNARQLISDVTGIGSQDIDETTINDREAQALRDAIGEAGGGRRGVLGYDDYQTSEHKNDDVGGTFSGSFAPLFKYFNPNYSMKTTIGQANYKQNRDGTYSVTDQYNFNDATGEGFSGVIDDFNEAEGFDKISPYRILRSVGRNYGSSEGEGGKVNINVGQLAQNKTGGPKIKRKQTYISKYGY